MPFFWDSMHFGRGADSHRNLHDGLFQIASQTCSLLVQVNNTNNITFGDNSMNVNCNTLRPEGNGAKVVTREESKDEQFMVLLPTTSKGTTYKPSTARSKSRLSTVLENGSFSHEEETDINHGFSFRDEDNVVIRWNNNNRSWCRPSCIPISIILVLIFLVVLLPLLDHAIEKSGNKTVEHILFPSKNCSNTCRLSLTESIPDGLIYPNGTTPYPSTHQTWLNLISSAQHTIEIGSFYWTLRENEIYPHPSSEKGEEIFQALLKAGTDGGIEIKIAQNYPTQENPNVDTEYLVKRKAAQVRSLNFAQLLGGGVLHTKFWLVDRTHLYVGSANMDWRSLTQVKELGIVVYNCSCLANDIGKIFDVYWFLGQNGSKVPDKWPASYETKINMESPADLVAHNETFQTYLSSSPPAFSPAGRTDDISAVLNVIQQAEKFIYISVMDYMPLMIYTPKVKFWPVIDDALRTAAIEHKVTVRLLISLWKSSRKAEDYFLRSLSAVSQSYPFVKIEVRRFVVSSTDDQSKIPFARVNHNKYMVTDNTAYIGTSNWSGDYFTNTAGVGFILHEPLTSSAPSNDTIRSQLQRVFERDWNSIYAVPLNISL